MGVATLTELDEFLVKNPIPEEYNYQAEYQYFHRKEGKLVGVVAYMQQKDASGKVYPRFIHVILDDEIKRTKEAYEFVMSTFRDIKEKGYNHVVAIIPHERKMMWIFAKRFGFERYAKDDTYGYWHAGIDTILRR